MGTSHFKSELFSFCATGAWMPTAVPYYAHDICTLCVARVCWCRFWLVLVREVYTTVGLFMGLFRFFGK